MEGKLINADPKTENVREKKRKSKCITLGKKKFFATSYIDSISFSVFRGKENRKFVIDTLKRRQIEKAVSE